MRSIFLGKPDPDELRRRTAGWRQLWVWLPAALAVAMIATESTGIFSSDNTSGWIRPFVERFVGHINDQLWYLLHHIARKSGHFSGFGLVALTFLRAWLLTLGTRPGFSVRRWRWESVVLAIASTFLIANFDEWHQTLLPSRTGLFSDVILDTIGGSFMCLLTALVCWFPSWSGRAPTPSAPPQTLIS